MTLDVDSDDDEEFAMLLELKEDDEDESQEEAASLSSPRGTKSTNASSRKPPHPLASLLGSDFISSSSSSSLSSSSLEEKEPKSTKKGSLKDVPETNHDTPKMPVPWKSPTKDDIVRALRQGENLMQLQRQWKEEREKRKRHAQRLEDEGGGGTGMQDPFGNSGSGRKKRFLQVGSMERGSSLEGSGETQEDKDYTEPRSRLRIKKRVVASNTLEEWFQQSNYYSIASLCRKMSMFHTAQERKAWEWCTLAVVTSVSEQLTSTAAYKASTSATSAPLDAEHAIKSYKYQRWWVRDFQSEQDLLVLVYGRAWEKYWKMTVGSVVWLRNGWWLSSDKEENASGSSGSSASSRFGVRVDQVDQVRWVGLSMDWGYCQAVRRDGQRCRSVVDSRATDYCGFHITQAASKKGKPGAKMEKHSVLRASHSAPIQQNMLINKGISDFLKTSQPQVGQAIPKIGEPGQFVAQKPSGVRPPAPKQMAIPSSSLTRVDYRGVACESQLKTFQVTSSGKLYKPKPPANTFASKAQDWQSQKKAAELVGGASMFNKGGAMAQNGTIKKPVHGFSSHATPVRPSSLHGMTTIRRPVSLLNTTSQQSSMSKLIPVDKIMATTGNKSGRSEELQLTELTGAQEFLSLDRQNSTVALPERDENTVNISKGPHESLLRAEKLAKDQKKQFKPDNPNKVFVKSLSEQELERRKRSALEIESLRDGESLSNIDPSRKLKEKKNFDLDMIYGEVEKKEPKVPAPKAAVVNKLEQEEQRRNDAFKSKASKFQIDVHDAEFMQRVRDYGINPDFLTDEDRRVIKRQLDAAEGSERIAEYLETNGRAVTVYRCRQCNIFGRQKPQMCQEKNHQFEQVQTKQFQLQCTSCKKFSVLFECDQRKRHICSYCPGLLRKPVQSSSKVTNLVSTSIESNLGRIGHL